MTNGPGTTRLHADSSQLLVIDVQERLAPAIESGEAATAAVCWLIDVARELDVPVLATEHCREAIGPLLGEVRSRLAEAEVHPKTHFAWSDEVGSLASLPRPQVVVCGMEAHVCVLQTALGLHEAGRAVFVVADAVGSRRPEDRQRGLERLAAAGVTVVTREMVAFEWLRHAGDERFRRVLPYIR